MKYILEPSKRIPVAYEVDLCVVGGSCTGVFAAVRAARLGLKVVIVEKQNCFGGVATNGLLNNWHRLYDGSNSNKLISGLTEEVLERLRRIGVLDDREKEISPDDQNSYYFNSEELKIELDKLITEHKIIPCLHTYFAGCAMEGDRIEAVFIENKAGRSAVRAQVFIDASGDGDLSISAGLESYRHSNIQPPTACCKLKFNPDIVPIEELVRKHGTEFGLEKDRGWFSHIPGAGDVYLMAMTHVFGVNCADFNDLVHAEMRGREQIRAYMDIVRKYSDSEISLMALCSYIGIRHTRQIKGLYQLKDSDFTNSTVFDDGIANVTYPIDIHGEDGTMDVRCISGYRRKFLLDGTIETGYWREKDDSKTFYQIPYRAMISKKCENLIFAGRMIDCEAAVFSSLRVMVNTNQMGEAAGVAAYEAINSGKPVYDIDVKRMKQTLNKGGSVVRGVQEKSSSDFS